jgi:tRNA(fMet)-specific endonuclease VapC
MLVLDTDHLVEYQRGTSPEAQRLKARLDQTQAPYGTTIITVEEMMRGWMAAVRRIHDPHRQVNAYRNLQRLFTFFATWHVLSWDEAAADQLRVLRQSKVRVGTMDLKIASICLARGATLLTRNRKDFENVPGLQLDDWLS